MIALVGSGEYLPPIEPVDRDLISRLQKPPRVICLPTAAGNEGPERIAYWSNLGIDHFTRLGASVRALPVIDRDSANDNDFAETIASANFVYLSGGKPAYLYETLEDSLAWEAILSVLKADGIVSGCSAGAMIMGEMFFAFSGWKTGFNFLTGTTIIPHFDGIPDRRRDAICSQVPEGLTVLGIDGNTALIQNKNQYEVLGSGGVTVWGETGKTRYTHGPIPLTTPLA